MLRKNTINQKISTIKVKGSKDFQQTANDLKEAGFMPLVVGNEEQKDVFSWNSYINNMTTCSSSSVGSNDNHSRLPVFFALSGAEDKLKSESIGTPKYGYIRWGADNQLPNKITALTSLLSYTAAGWKFNTDLSAGLGPQPMYQYTQYVGGNIVEKEIPYSKAGILLKGMIIDLQRQRLNIETSVAEENKKSAKQDLIASFDEQIANLREKLAVWEKTNKEVLTFIENNNLEHTFLQLFGDYQMLGLCFPELLLNQQQLDEKGKAVETSLWKPKVIGISYRPAHITRFERMDENGRINFVYISNRWLDNTQLTNVPLEMAALPVIGYENPLGDLNKAIVKARQHHLETKDRPTRFVMPSIYPSVGRPYYPIPAWHSIFAGDIYEYAATMISDRVTRQKNSNVIGRVVYVHNDYLKQLYLQGKCDTTEKEQQLRSQLFGQINKWLANRDNSGQSLWGYTFTGNDGKEHDSFKIVEIEGNNKNTAEANQKELQEVSSIIFFAMGLDSRLIGNTPGTATSSGGTDLRERYLLKQVQMSPTQQIVLKPLEVLSRFNEWDTHLVWRIKREVLTTLDRSKTGITEAETK